jgi:hypothetical protein
MEEVTHRLIPDIRDIILTPEVARVYSEIDGFSAGPEVFQTSPTEESGGGVHAFTGDAEHSRVTCWTFCAASEEGVLELLVDTREGRSTYNESSPRAAARLSSHRKILMVMSPKGASRSFCDISLSTAIERPSVSSRDPRSPPRPLRHRQDRTGS